MTTITTNTPIPMETSEFFLEHKGIPLHMKLELPQGDEKTITLVLLVHGFTGHMEEAHLVAAKDTILSKGCAVLRVELYGHGKSGGNFCDHDMNIWLDEICGVIDYVKGLPWVSKLILAGHSQGGLLTVMVGAQECAKKLSALVPMSPGFIIPDDAKNGTCFGQNFDPDNIPETIHLFGDFYLKAGYFKVNQTIVTDDYVKAYDGIVRIIHGSADEIIPVETSRRAEEIYKNCRLYEIEGADHGFTKHIEELKDVVAKVIDELK